MTKKSLCLIAVLLLLVLLFLYFDKQTAGVTASPTSEQQQSSDLASVVDKDAYRDLSAAHMKGYGEVVTSPQKDAEILSTLVSSYLMVMKDYNALPLGENRETTAALLGENEYRTRVLSADSPWINDNGELIDRWGTPVFFHGSLNDQVGIRIAGPDKKIWTEDDIISNQSAEEYSD